MKINYPYIYTSDKTLINQSVSFNNETGVSYKPHEGVHAIWAARVPFLPAMLSDDLVRFGNNRLQLIQLRQFRFIYDLARIREHHSTFALRFISSPNPVPGQPNIIDIVFLGKVFSKDQQRALIHSEHLWERFTSIFPKEEPFGYPLEPVSEKSEFLEYYEPIDLSEAAYENFLEIRKYEDMPIPSKGTLARGVKAGDYIAHPFVPGQTSNPMSRFLMALADQPEKCFVDISLRPTKMFDQEIYNVSFMIGRFKKSAREDDDITEEYLSKRAQIGVFVYENLMLEREQLLMVRVHIVGENEAPRGLAEALGSEMMGNAANKYPTSWVAAQPVDDQQLFAEIRNVRYLEHDFWGKTIADQPLRRLRYFCTAQEAYGAFRLPISPESGYVPGVLVRNEPFISPTDELELREQTRENRNDLQTVTIAAAKAKKVSLGKVYHRGTATEEDFTIPIRDLTRHALIAGSTGSGKSTTIKHLLSQLWLDHGCPFMVLYPVDKPDYRELMAIKKMEEDLLVFTLGDEGTSPFHFNPFEVQDGILIKTHISKIMRVFESAFSLHEPLPMIYREALRKIYRDKGWNVSLDRGSSAHEYPIMSEFYDAIKAITESLEYGREVGDNVRQASVIRIGDLMENVGHALNVRKSMSFDTILSTPTIMELGRIGSTDDISLIMGFLMVCFGEAIETHPRPKDKPHITVVEEAHRLMADSNPSQNREGSTRGNASEDFGNMLAEVRAFGEGIIIAEQIPTVLVKGAIGNTYIKIMHWLEDAPSFELFSTITNLDQNQRDYARTLKPGFAIVRSRYGRPIHLKVPEFGDQNRFEFETPDISDQTIRLQMTNRVRQLGLEMVPTIKWVSAFSFVNNHENKPGSSDFNGKGVEDRWVIAMPMRSCLYCPGRKAFRCDYKKNVTQQFLSDPVLSGTLSTRTKALIESNTEKELNIRLCQLEKWIFKKVPGDKIQTKGLLYCLIAHQADIMRNTYTEDAIKKRRMGKLLQFISKREV